VNLADLRDDLSRRGTTGLLVIRGEETLLEWYADGWSAERPHYTASLAKAIVGGTSLILTLQDGLIGADDPAVRYVPQWLRQPLKEDITVRHLATHSSGLADTEHVDDPDWMRRFWKRDEPDPFTVARDDVPMQFAPGTDYEYSNPGMAMLAYCVTAALQASHAAQKDIRTLLRKRVLEPIGIGEGTYSIGYGATYTVEGLPLVANWGGGSMTARQIARVGRLMLQGGAWEGPRILDPDLVAQALTYGGTALPDRGPDNPVPASGLCWYTNEDGVWPQVPPDAFAGGGAGHQLLLGVPSLDLVVVRQGEHLDGDQKAGFWGPAYRQLFEPLMRALI
jgi:CubicO group peptidase (beta-lactamase class C family)